MAVNTLAIFFFEAYISSTNCIRCPTLRPYRCRIIAALQLMFSKFKFDGKLNPTYVEGAFHLLLSSIQTYIKYPICLRFVHIHPDRPGLDLSKQPPAVCLNKELGYILIFKLKVEDLLRESGIPYAIIRPCALTEEPAGADLIFEQGDNIMVRYQGKRLLISALLLWTAHLLVTRHLR